MDIPPAAEPLAHPPEAPEVPEDEKKEDEEEEPTAEPEDDEEMQGGAVGHKSDTKSVELKQRRKAHRNTRESEETSADEISEAASHTCFTF